MNDLEREPLDRERIESLLAGNGAASAGRVEVLEAVDSTNERLLRRPGPVHAVVCIAERQTAGRGRGGRSWHAEPGGGILLSIGWEFGPGKAPLGASLAAGVAVAEALEQFGIEGVGLKWPNDLLAGRRKLGGILVELRRTGHGACRCVVGLGLNVRMGATADAVIDQPWIDLAEMGHGGIDRNLLAAAIITRLCAGLERFAAEGFAPLRGAWLARHVHQGRRVTVSGPRGATCGTVVGVDDEGALLLRDAKGTLRRMLAGDVSLREA